MNIYTKTGFLLLTVFGVHLAIILVLIFIDRFKLDELSKKKEYLGKVIGGIYTKPLIPYEEEGDEAFNKVVRRHNKKITLFYLSFFVLLAAVFLLNIGEDN